MKYSRFKYFLPFVLILNILCSGCGDRQPQINPISKNSRILAFGDSITYGTGAGPEESYPSALSNLLGCEVINAGIPGEMTKEGVERLPSLLEEYNPDVVIICHGGNDLLGQRNNNSIENNLENMIIAAKNSNCDVILVGVPSPALILHPPEFYKKIAKKYNIPYEGKIISNILNSPSLKSDPIHPNANGYRKLAEALKKIFVRQKLRDYYTS